MGTHPPTSFKLPQINISGERVKCIYRRVVSAVELKCLLAIYADQFAEMNQRILEVLPTLPVPTVVKPYMP